MTDAAAPPVLIAVGDVHGRADLLRQLVALSERRYGDRARFVFLGDYVDRGPDSRAVIDELLTLRRRRPGSVFLKGNHEQAMLDFLAEPEEGIAWLEWGGRETLASYGVTAELLGDHPADRPWEARDALAERMPDRHFAFLMRLGLTHREGEYLFVHAGLDPERPIEDQRERDLLWIRDAFTRGGKGRFPGLTVVHGHTPVAKPENKSWRVNVDTGAVWSGRLTALVLEDGKRSFVST